MNQISFEEISDGDQFEDLVAEYFRELKKDSENNITNVKVLASGIGTDGGKDILVEFELSDEITVFKRTWIIQCKFHKGTISPSQINKINIPTLIHSHNATGYLLVCKSRPTSGITDLFERLNENCTNGYHYECWSGSQFINKLMIMDQIHGQYFPEFHAYINSKSPKS